MAAQQFPLKTLIWRLAPFIRYIIPLSISVGVKNVIEIDWRTKKSLRRCMNRQTSKAEDMSQGYHHLSTSGWSPAKQISYFSSIRSTGSKNWSDRQQWTTSCTLTPSSSYLDRWLPTNVWFIASSTLNYQEFLLQLIINKLRRKENGHATWLQVYRTLNYSWESKGSPISFRM